MKTSNLQVLPSKFDETYDLIEKYRDLDRQIKALTKEKDAIGKELKAGYFLSHDDYVHDGRLLATYRPQIRVSLDQKSFEAKHPVIYNDFLVANEIRVFLLR